MSFPLIAKVILALGGGALLLGVGAKEAGAAGKMPPWLLSQYQSAKANAASRPEDLDKVAKLLQQNGFPNEAQELLDLARVRAIADSPHTNEADKLQAEAVTAVAQVQAQTPTKAPAPGAPAAPVSTPVVTTTQERSYKLNAQQALAKKLADHLNALVLASGGVARAKGHEDKSLVLTFQSQNGLKGDGSWGPKSALTMATLWGDVPIVFYWPKLSQPNTAVPKYRSDLEVAAQLADKGNDYDQTRAAMIRLAAAREKGQGFGSGTIVSSSGMTAAEAALLQQQVASAFFR